MSQLKPAAIHVDAKGMPPIRRLLFSVLAGALLVPAAAAAGGPRTAYVTNQGADRLTSLNVFTNSPLGTIAVPNGPRGIAITPDGATAYVVNQFGDTVTPVDTATNTVGPAIAVGDQPGGVAITPDGATVYVTNYSGNTLTPVATATNTAGPPIAVGPGPIAAAVTPDGATVYVLNNSDGTVTPVDTATNVAGSAIAVGGLPSGIAITPDGATAYVSGGFPGAGGSNTVVPLSTATNTVGPAIPVGSYPWGVAITPDGATAYVTNAISNTVTPIDTATDVPGAAIPVGSLPTSISITPDGSSAYVTNLGDDSVSVISTQTNTVTATLTGHISGFGVGIVPDQAPGAAFTSHAGATGAATGFDAAASTDPDGSVASYGWSFGDGQNATTAGPTVAHVYANPGTYTATLTVVDDEGCSMAIVFTGQTAFCNGSAAARVQHQVTVTAAPAPDPPDTAARYAKAVRARRPRHPALRSGGALRAPVAFREGTGGAAAAVGARDAGAGRDRPRSGHQGTQDLPAAKSHPPLPGPPQAGRRGQEHVDPARRRGGLPPAHARRAAGPGPLPHHRARLHGQAHALAACPPLGSGAELAPRSRGAG